MAMILDSQIDFIANKRLLLDKHYDLFVVLFVTVLLDATSTHMFMFTLGTESELNPFVRRICELIGIYLGPFIGKIGQLFAVFGLTVLAPRLTVFICTVTIFLNLGAFMINCNVFFSTF